MKLIKPILIIIGFVLFILVWLFLANPFATQRCRNVRYQSPAWMDNEHIICVKYVNTFIAREGWIYDLGNGTSQPEKDEIQIVSMKIDGTDEKVLKTITIHWPGRYWEEKEFEGVSFIDGVAYNRQRGMIAFDTRGGKNEQLFIMNADGTSVKKITDNGWKEVFSPDGKYLQYTFQYKVWLYDLDTQESKVLLENAIGGPFSPDGKKIAFSRKVEKYLNVFIYDLETKEEKLYTSNYEFINDWTPDGRIIEGAIGELSDPRVSPDGAKVVGIPGGNAKDKMFKYIGISDINGKNLELLRYERYE